jgi:alpha-beta hydrolase superfamily lysophospholipase
MEPTFFGDPRLFGLYHPPEATGPRSDTGVLLCPPVGHEHTRSHRALRVLAEALARDGFHALRFDYRGMGDSSGDSADGTVERWCDDVDAALGELQELSGAGAVFLVGLRLGASLAVRALARPAPRRRPRVRRAVLWDPVVSGAEFLELATCLQAAFVVDPTRFPDESHGPGRSNQADGLLGYSYSVDLRRSLRELDLRQVRPWPDVPTSFVLSRRSAATDSLAESLRGSGHLADHEVVAGSEGNWEEYLRHEDVLRAGTAVRAVLAQIEGATR